MKLWETDVWVEDAVPTAVEAATPRGSRVLLKTRYLWGAEKRNSSALWSDAADWIHAFKMSFQTHIDTAGDAFWRHRKAAEAAPLDLAAVAARPMTT
jgi:hypothetical protein